jgi:hypothetical protein
LPDGGQKNPPEYLQVPYIRVDKIQIVVRIGFAAVKDRVELVLDIRNVELRSLDE